MFDQLSIQNHGIHFYLRYQQWWKKIRRKKKKQVQEKEKEKKGKERKGKEKKRKGIV